jgi:hypothetical protein
MKIELQDESSENQILTWILNVRSISVLLANIWWNQVKTLIRERVVYDRDMFNFEEYN